MFEIIYVKLSFVFESLWGLMLCALVYIILPYLHFPNLYNGCGIFKISMTSLISQNSQNYENKSQCSLVFKYPMDTIFYILQYMILPLVAPWIPKKILSNCPQILVWVPPLQPTCTVYYELSPISHNRQMHTLGRMLKGIWKEMFKAPALHTNRHPLVSNSNKHTYTHSNTFLFSAQVSCYRHPPCPLCLSACQLQKK